MLYAALKRRSSTLMFYAPIRLRSGQAAYAPLFQVDASFANA
jgi:hypothetical protein